MILTHVMAIIAFSSLILARCIIAYRHNKTWARLRSPYDNAIAELIEGVLRWARAEFAFQDGTQVVIAQITRHGPECELNATCDEWNKKYIGNITSVSFSFYSDIASVCCNTDEEIALLYRGRGFSGAGRRNAELEYDKPKRFVFDFEAFLKKRDL